MRFWLLPMAVLTAGREADGFRTADVPTPRFKFEPGTIHVTVPKSPGMSLAAIHLTVNEPVHGTRPGKINKDLAQDGGVFRTTVHFQWQTGDVIYYWVYVIVDGLGYQRLEQSHTIRSRNTGTPRPPQQGPFVVPTPRFHFTPHTITVTVPALPGVSLAAIHLSLNEPLPGTQAGRYNQDLDKNGDMFTTMVHAPWKKGDTINYWVYVIYNGLGQQKLGQSFVIESGPKVGQPGPTPQPTLSSQLPTACGTRFIDDLGLDFTFGSTRVSNASEVSTGDYPWQAQIRTRSGHHCGGIIISDRHILTAAHCLTSVLERDLEVVVGQHNLNSSNDPEERVFGVIQGFKHNTFLAGSLAGYSNDIAVILLRTNQGGPIQFGDYVRPACLPSGGEELGVHTACLVSGWGRTSTEMSPVILHGTRIPYVSPTFCSSDEVWGMQFNGTSQLCAGDVGGGRDACGGDSGGPLTCQDSQGRWIATGIVSWGSDDCGATRRVGVYTRVSSYVDWITHVIDNVFGIVG